MQIREIVFLAGSHCPGIVHFLEVPLFHGRQKKQKTTSKSSAESEYGSMSTATAELVW